MESNKSLDTEIRKLDPIEIYKLGQILNISDSWKQLLSVILKEDNQPRFNSEHIKIIEQAVLQQRRNAAEILLDEWGTMGKTRPTLGILLDLVMKIQLYRVADYIAVDILKGEPPIRPQIGPAAPVDVSDQAIADLLQEVIPKMKSTSLDSNFSGACFVSTSNQNLAQNQTNPLRLNYTNDLSKDDTNSTLPMYHKSELKKFSKDITDGDESSRHLNTYIKNDNVEQNMIMRTSEIPWCVNDLVDTNVLDSILNSIEIPLPLCELSIHSNDKNCNTPELDSIKNEITIDTDTNSKLTFNMSKVELNSNELPQIGEQSEPNNLLDQVTYNNEQMNTQELPLVLLKFNPS